MEDLIMNLINTTKNEKENCQVEKKKNCQYDDFH